MGTRRERVILELQDDFTSDMARAAVATGLLDKQLESLSRNAVVTSRTQAQVSRSIDNTAVSADRAGASIDRLSGRVQILGDMVAMLGPALSPIGAVGAAGIGGLVNQLSVAVLAGGSAFLAFQGIGDVLETVNKAALEPTADNLEKAHRAMSVLSPATREAVRALQGLNPLLADMKAAGADAVMPGFVSMLEDLGDRGPEITNIVYRLNSVLGDLMSSGGSALASDNWDDFFDFLAQDSAQTLASMGRSLGNLSKGFSELWMAFDPLSDGFNDWLEDASEGFAKWADGLSESERFQDFITYVFESGPQVTATVTALADAMLAVMEAASPLGGPVLSALESVAEAVATIARSDMGTPIMAGVAALALFNRTAAVAGGLSASAAAGGGLMGFLGGSTGGKGLAASRSAISGARADLAALAAGYATAGARSERETARMNSSAKSLRTNLGGIASGAGPAGIALAGVGVAASGAADGMTLANTAMLGMVGAMGGPLGAAAGATAGQLMDLSAANDSAAAATDNLTEALARQKGTATQSEYDTLLTQYNSAADKVTEMADRLNNPSYTSMSDILLGAKNSLEGIFGRDDYEEEFEKMEAARKEMGRLESEARRLGDIDFEMQQWEEFTAGVVASGDEAGKTAASFLALGESLNDREVSLGGWLKDLEEANEALKNFRVNSEKAGEKGLKDGLIKQLQEAGPEGALRLSQLADASEAEIRRANRAFVRGERQAAAYAASVQGIPPEITTIIGQHGMPKSLGDIQRLQEKYDLTPEEVNTLAVLSGVEGAESLLNQLTRPRTATVTVLTNTQGSPLDVRVGGGRSLANANGSVTDYYANGGVRENHVAQIASANTIRVWAEPETEGEAYIPLAASKRNRSLDIWAETGRRLGVEGFATGGVKATAPISIRGSQVKVDGVWRDFEQGLRILTRQFDKSERSLDRMRDRVDAVRDQMEEAGDRATGQFLPDLFATSNSPWTSQGSDPLGVLRQSTSDLKERQVLMARLKRQGLTGAAFSASMEGSNDDLRALLDGRQVREFQQQYNLNARWQSRVESTAGQYSFGRQERARIADVRELKTEVRRLRKSQERTEAAQKKWQKDNRDVGKAAGNASSKAASRGVTSKRR